MANTIITVAMLQREVIRKIDRYAIIAPTANREYERTGLDGLLSQGDTVTVQTFPRITGTLGGTLGDDISETNFAITSENFQILDSYQLNVPIKDIEKIRSNLPLETHVAEQIAYDVAQMYDKKVAQIVVTNANSSNVLNASTNYTPDGSTVYGKLTEMSELADIQDLTDVDLDLFVTPKMWRYIKESGVYDTVDAGFKIRQSNGAAATRGYRGKMDRYNIFVTNNCPYRQKVTFASAPSNTEAMTITDGTDTVTVQFVTSIGTAAGNILIGNAAVCYTNLQTLLNTPGTTTANGVALAAADISLLKKWRLHLGDATSTVSYETSAVPLVFADTIVTNTDWVSGTEYRVVFALQPQKSVHFVAQMTKMKTTDAEAAFKMNILTEHAFDGKVFDENAKRIFTMGVDK